VPDHPIFVTADYYLASFLQKPGWVEDIRPFRAVMMPLDLPAKTDDIERFIPQHAAGNVMMERARKSYAFDMGTAMRKAMADLKLDSGRIGFDDIGYGLRLGMDGVEVTDCTEALMSARRVKTEAEMKLLQRSTNLNEAAIQKTVASWSKGATWRDLNHAYSCAVVELGGFVRDPGGMVWGHPRGSDPTLMLQTGLEDEEVAPGTHVMFDCHGTLDLYCWDGGKTWVVEGEPEGGAKLFATATSDVAEALLDAMRPGAKVSGLQALARDVYRKSGVPDPASAVIFFHGLGLSHWDMELTNAEGKPNSDWVLEEGMVTPIHLLYPGGEHERSWLEEVIVIGKDGGRPLFSWGFDPITAG
jgi:Xaa-Pro aminopeptidase